MRFRVSRVGVEGLDLRFDEDRAAFERLLGLAPDEPTAVRAAGSLHVRASVTASGTDLLLQGSVMGPVQVACRRCLAAVPVELDLPLRVTLVPPAVADALPEEKELHADDLEVATYEGEDVQIDDLVREQILLGVPAYPLCREDCAGLCPQCGKDLNEGACGCEATVDPRLAKLREIKIDPAE